MNTKALTTAEKEFDAHVATVATRKLKGVDDLSQTKRRLKKGVATTERDKKNDIMNQRCELLATAIKKLVFADSEHGKAIRIGRAQLKAMLNVPYLRETHTGLLDEICLEFDLVMTDVDGFFIFTPLKKLQNITPVTSLICLGIKADIDIAMNVQPKAKRGE